MLFAESIFCFFIYIVKSYIVYRTARFVYNVIRLIYVYRVAPRLGIGFDFQKYKNKWTVITGPTDGIGKEYLLQLAAKGLQKFVLVSRDNRKLQATKEWLLSSYPNCEIKTQAFTFGRDDYSIMRKALESLEIGILVNNAGTGPEILQRFSEDPPTDRMVYKVNTESVFEMMQIALPKMKEAKGGAIINVSSLQSVRPIALLASYSTSKTYVAHLTDCVRREYKSDGITVQCIIPILVETKILQYNANDIPLIDQLLVVQPKKFAEEAINTLGVASYTTGCIWHEFQLALVYLLPWWLLIFLADPYYRLHQRRMLREYKRKMKK